jgi:hypothetical protein
MITPDEFFFTIKPIWNGFNLKFTLLFTWRVVVLLFFVCPF